MNLLTPTDSATRARPARRVNAVVAAALATASIAFVLANSLHRRHAREIETLGADLHQTATFGHSYELAAALMLCALLALTTAVVLLMRRTRTLDRELDAHARHLAAAMGTAPVGTWEWNIRTGAVRWSRKVWEMFGLEPDSRALDFTVFRDALHPDDRERVMAALERAVATRSPYHCEARIVWPDGSVRWTRTHGQIVPGTDGAPELMVGVDIDITAAKISEAARRASDDLFVTAFERTVLGMGLVATDGRWLKVNDALCRLLGYTREELLALDFQRLTHPEDLPESLEQGRRLHAGEIELLRQEKRYRHRDGHYLWVYVTVGLVRDAHGQPSCHVTQVQDIDARKRAETALASAQRAIATSEREHLELLARLNEAQHAAGIGSWSWEIASGRVWWSDELYRIFELDPADYTPSVAANARHVHADDRAAYESLVERSLAAGNDFESDLRIVTGLGHERHCRCRGCVECATDGTVTRVFGTLQDRTEAHLMEERLRDAHRMESLGGLAGGIAHDFNNLLAAILGNVTLARARANDVRAVQDKLARIEEAGRRAKTLVDQILSFSRRQPLEVQAVDLRALVHETAGLLRATIPAGVTLDVEIDDATPAALADASQLHQVLMNLCTNAWLAIRERSAPDGRIAVRVRGEVLDAEQARALDLRLRPGPYCRIEVRDNGIGMDTATRARIFEPFFTTRAPGSGTGLGLSVVHGIVTALHGAITVDSAHGEGSRFTL